MNESSISRAFAGPIQSTVTRQEREALRQKLAADTEAFLKAGGQIQQLGTTEPAELWTKPGGPRGRHVA